MLKIILLRHSITEGNQKKRYIGTTDEPLCEAGIELLRDKYYPQGAELFASPLLRCTQTAELIYPGQRIHIIEDLRECDFGEFENKNYIELADNPKYQQWIDSEGTIPFPGGESREEFRWRALRGFERVITYCLKREAPSAAVVVHGGTIMSIMEEYAVPEKGYYEWHVDNGCGYLVQLDEKQWKAGYRQLDVLKKIGMKDS